jgi:hypothetical protein
MKITSSTHPDLIKVNKSAEPFASGNISLVDRPAGTHFASIKNATPAARHYTTVQTSANTHISLNSDLVYCNHSCAPTLIFDMNKFEVRVVDDRPLKAGDPLTFFYPSTEWDMEQPFDCHCGGAEGWPCKGKIQGAKFLSDEDLKGYWLNKHIKELLAERASKEKERANL